MHRVLWVKIDVACYRGLTLINNINLSNFCPPIYLTLKSLDGRNHRLGHLFEMKLDNKIIDLCYTQLCNKSQSPILFHFTDDINSTPKLAKTWRSTNGYQIEYVKYKRTKPYFQIFL